MLFWCQFFGNVTGSKKGVVDDSKHPENGGAVKGKAANTGIRVDSEHPFWRLVVAFLACCAALYPRKAGGTLRQVVKDRGLDFSTSYRVSFTRQCQVYDCRETRNEVCSSMRRITDSRVCLPCQKLVAGMVYGILPTVSGPFLRSS